MTRNFIIFRSGIIFKISIRSKRIRINQPPPAVGIEYLRGVISSVSHGCHMNPVPLPVSRYIFNRIKHITRLPCTSSSGARDAGHSPMLTGSSAGSCSVCGHAHEVSKAPAYLEVEDYTEAEHIVKQMEKHLQTTKKTDFTQEETVELRHHYTEALKKSSRGITRNFCVNLRIFPRKFPR